uniref:Uncharacterized protein n=1 Tax=Setaria italica TaxID=4555 RepID=K3ZG69_SETIT
MPDCSCFRMQEMQLCPVSSMVCCKHSSVQGWYKNRGYWCTVQG